MFNFKRIIKAGFTNFSRSGLVSISSVLVMTVTLCVIASLIFLQAILVSSLSEVKNKIDITVYFISDTNEENIISLKSAIEKLPETASVAYTSAEEALENFKMKHANDYLILQALDELDKNPLGAFLNIKAREPSQYESIAGFLEGESALSKDDKSIIDKVNYNQNKTVIEKLNIIISGVQKLGFLITLIFAIISVIITFNTIRLTIYISREEINIMRLVGASNYFIRGPFLVEGIIYGLISSILTMAIFYPITYWLGNSMTFFFGLNMHDYYLSNFFEIFGIILLFGIVITMISSFLAIRKYLRK